MPDLEAADIAAVIAASSSFDEDEVWGVGTCALARYGISEGPARDKHVTMRDALRRRVAEIADSDGGFWRAVPQAVHELSGEEATPREMGCATVIFVSGLGHGGAMEAVLADMEGAAGARWDAGRALSFRKRRRGGAPGMRPPGGRPS